MSGIRTGGNTQIAAELIPLPRLLDRLARGTIRVPRFQRPFVWEPQQMIELLDSVRRQYPIGSIMLWDSDQIYDSIDHIGPIKIPEIELSETTYILDGYQRLSTLLGTLKAPNGGEGKWRVAYDLEREEFFHLGNKKPSRPWIAISRLLKTSDFLSEIDRITASNISEEHTRALIRQAEMVARSFKEYPVPFIRVLKADLPTAVQIFSRLNSRGTTISGDQMISALTYSRGHFHLSEELDDLQEEIMALGFGGLSRTTLLRTVLAAAGAEVYETDWVMLAGQWTTNRTKDAGFDRTKNVPGVETLAAAVRATKETIRQAIEFLRGEGVIGDPLLPYSFQIVLLAEFFRICHEPDAAQITALKKWFWNTSFNGYFTSLTSDRASKALLSMRNLATGAAYEIGGWDRPALPLPARFHANHSRIRAYLVFLLSLKPRSLRDGKPLMAASIVGALGLKSFRRLLDGSGEDLRHRTANRILLDLDQTESAEQLILALDDKDRREICETHGITSLAFEHLKAGRREDFIADRQHYLRQEEERFMASRDVHPPPHEESRRDLMDLDEDFSFPPWE